MEQGYNADMNGAISRIAATEQTRRQQLMKNGMHARMRTTMQIAMHTVPVFHATAPPIERKAPVLKLSGVLSMAGAGALPWYSCVSARLAPSRGLAAADARQRLRRTIADISTSGSVYHYICVSELLLASVCQRLRT